MTRRADRRRYAIAGTLAEHAPLTIADVGQILRYPSMLTVLDLDLMEERGRVVSSWFSSR